MARSVSAVLTCLAVTVLAACSVARSGAWNYAQEHYAAREYREAIEKTENLLSYGTPSPRERADAYLMQARCYERLGDLDQATGLYLFVSKEFPETPQDYRARGLRARVEKTVERQKQEAARDQPRESSGAPSPLMRHEVLGEWRDQVSQYWDTRNRITKYGTTYTVLITWTDGSSEEIQLSPTHSPTSAHSRAFRASSGEIFAIHQDGYLDFYDSQGFIRRAAPVRAP